MFLNSKVHISELHHFYIVPLHLAPLKWYFNLTFTQNGSLRWGSNHAHFPQAAQSERAQCYCLMYQTPSAEHFAVV